MEFPHDLGELTVFIFDLVGLVDDDVVPFDLLQTVEANSDTLKASH